MPLTFYAVSVIIAFGVTVALVLQIYMDEGLVKGVLVSDHELCTALGQRVLRDGGSTVDAAIAGALCLGIVHPHVSGVGGGGVMLVHNMEINETRVIDFQGAAPQRYDEEMMKNPSEFKTGLWVGVPGMLLGLHCAHSLYGSLSWEDVINRAADVATEGFNVSLSLSDAISKVNGEQLPQHFRNTFMPEGRALHPGSHMKMPGLAGVLRAGLLNFYNGNLSQEIEDEVQANGGVLSRVDISSYRVRTEQPLEGRHNGFIIQVPPPPSAGALLVSALNVLESFTLRENNITENQTHHWIAEALKAASSVTSGLGHLKYSETELSKTQADVVVMGSDNLMVSVASSLSRLFGSRIITQSGIILNSLLLDLYGSHNTSGQVHSHQRNGVGSGNRPLPSLMPTLMLPAGDKRGIYVALGSSAGQNLLGAITKVLNSTLMAHNERNVSHSLGRPHIRVQPSRLLFDPEFPEEIVQRLDDNSYIVQRVKTHSSVQGIQRNTSIKAINIHQVFDHFL